MAGEPPGYVYLHTPLPSAQFFDHDAYSKDCEGDKDFDPDLTTDEDTSTGQYTICCVVIQMTSIVQMTAAN